MPYFSQDKDDRTSQIWKDSQKYKKTTTDIIWMNHTPGELERFKEILTPAQELQELADVLLEGDDGESIDWNDTIDLESMLEE